jgi:hypothetical protein
VPQSPLPVNFASQRVVGRGRALTLSDIPANTNVTGAGSSPNLDTILPDYSNSNFNFAMIFINGILLCVGRDVVQGVSSGTGDLQFVFDLYVEDQIDVLYLL